MGVTDRDDSDIETVFRQTVVPLVALAAEVLEHRDEIERLRAENAELRRTLDAHRRGSTLEVELDDAQTEWEARDD